MNKKALIIGGSGGLSGRLAVMAKEGYEVWVLTRGIREIPQGVAHIVADRDKKDEFMDAVLQQNMNWDVVFDCICMNEEHAKQDLEVLSKITKRLIVISTDSVYDPKHKQTPQAEDGMFVEETGTPDRCSYAGNKRKMEKVFLDYLESGNTEVKITIFRPGHIYGPGFLLGCFPEHSRQENLVDIILKGEDIRLVGGGIYLTQPIYVDDLAITMLDCVNNEKTYNHIFCIGGPQAVENKQYYEIIAKLLSKDIHIKEIMMDGYLDKNPGFEGHLCHRIYDLSKLRKTGVAMPATTLETGLGRKLAERKH